MNHKHVGPEDEACTGCIGEYARIERRKTIAGLTLLVVLVIAAMVLLSWYLNTRGPHLR